MRFLRWKHAPSEADYQVFYTKLRFQSLKDRLLTPEAAIELKELKFQRTEITDAIIAIIKLHAIILSFA